MLPVLAAAVLGLAWLVSLTVAQVRVVDAARETARLAARGEPPGVAIAVGRRIAPEGARIRVRGAAGTPALVMVEVSADVAGPGRLLSSVPLVTLRHETVAAREPG